MLSFAVALGRVKHKDSLREKPRYRKDDHRTARAVSGSPLCNQLMLEAPRMLLGMHLTSHSF